jgi:hypothetical protein
MKSCRAAKLAQGSSFIKPRKARMLTPEGILQTVVQHADPTRPSARPLRRVRRCARVSGDGAGVCSTSVRAPGASFAAGVAVWNVGGYRRMPALCTPARSSPLAVALRPRVARVRQSAARRPATNSIID